MDGRDGYDEREGEPGECSGCSIATSRRYFLGQMSVTVLAAWVVGQLGSEVAALPMTTGSGTQTGADERRYPIPAADGVMIDREAQIILVRAGGAVYAFNLACPHENTALRWRAQDGRFQCPRHESKYQPDGTFMSGRATRNMDRFVVARSGGDIVVNVSRLLRSDQDAAAWAAAVVKA